MKHLFDGELSDTLARDPLAEFELITGKSCRDAESQEDKLAILGHAMAVNSDKRAALALTGDSHFGTTLSEYVTLIESLGFAFVTSYQFRKDSRDFDDNLFLYWDATRGILLAFDSWHGGKINGGHFYYCWRPTSDDCWGVTSSGHNREDGVWVGHHDCREAIAFHIRQLDSHGEFVKPWPERPFMWLIGYGEDSTQYKDIGTERLAALPESIRQAIGFVTPHPGTPGE